MSSIRVQRHLRSRVIILLCGILFSSFESSASADPESCPHSICEGVEEGRFLDNPFSCAAWFQCRDGRAVSGECPGGSWFNYEQQLCDWPFNVRCDAEVSEIVELECVTVEEPDYTISCRTTDELHTVPHPYDCNRYYVCVSGEAMGRSCAPGLEFNPVMSQCMAPEEANCVKTACPPYNIPLTFLPSNESCSAYYVCLFGEPLPLFCAEGLHWDQNNNWCTDPKDANCEVRD